MRCANCDKQFIPQTPESKYCTECDWKEGPEISREELAEMMKRFLENKGKSDE